MTDRSYGIATIVGTSPQSLDTAIRNAVQRAGELHKHVDWFEVDQIRGYVRENGVDHFQVTVRVGYRLEDQ
jgi:flavin-binding protein dodecin